MCNARLRRPPPPYERRGKREASGSMPLLRAESGQKEVEATKDGCTPIAKAMVLPRSPDEALVVDIALGLNGCDVVKQANGVLVKTASRVGNHGEEGDVKTLVWRRVLSVFLVSA